MGRPRATAGHVLRRGEAPGRGGRSSSTRAAAAAVATDGTQPRFPSPPPSNSSASASAPVTGRAGTGVRSATIENCTAAALGLPATSGEVRRPGSAAAGEVGVGSGDASGADSRAAPCGASGRAAGGAAVVLERLSPIASPGSYARRRDPPRGWSTGPSPPDTTSPSPGPPRRRSCRPSFAVAFEHRLAHRA